MSARSALINTVVAESPFTIVAHIAPPIAVVRPSETFNAESSTLKTVIGVFSGQSLSSFSATWYTFWGNISAGQ